MTRGVTIVRLAASVTVGYAACWFVVMYHAAATARFPFDHPNADGEYTESGRFVLDGPTPAVAFVTRYGRYAYAVPVVGLLAGAAVIWRWPDRPALVEMIVSAMWVVSLVWAGFVIVIWQWQNIPIFHGMRWRY